MQWRHRAGRKLLPGDWCWPRSTAPRFAERPRAPMRSAWGRWCAACPLRHAAEPIATRRSQTPAALRSRRPPREGVPGRRWRLPAVCSCRRRARESACLTPSPARGSPCRRASRPASRAPVVRSVHRCCRARRRGAVPGVRACPCAPRSA